MERLSWEREYAAPLPVFEGFAFPTEEIRKREPLYSLNRREVRELWDVVNWAIDLYDSGVIADFSVDLKGVVRFCNRRAAALLGYERNDLFGKPLTFLYAHTPEGRQQADRLLKRCRCGEEIDGETLQMRRRDGSPIRVNLYARLVEREGGGGIRLSAVDGAVQAASGGTAPSGSLLEAIAPLAGGIAHDFNNLIGACQGYVELAQMKLTDKDGPVPRYLDRAVGSCQQAAALAGRLTTFSSGGEPLKESVSLGDVLRVSLEAATEGDEAIEVQSRIEAALPLVLADRRQLRQVFDELLKNAREAMGGCGRLRVLAAACRIGAGEDPRLAPGDYLAVVIEDTGEGIAAEDLPRIFDPYFTTKPMGKEKGSGLGLAVCWSILRRHGGGIRATSEPGKGTIVTVHLPICPPG